ncbi:anaerobic magnesium-protoporphyrin IX monomethyl ester cyclase [Candidatus Magnetomoraceae bacterium gMMP-15]
MRALIINPPWETDKGYGARSNCRWPHVETTRFTHFPIYLGYTAAVLLKAGIKVNVLDCAVNNLNFSGMLKAIKNKSADICFIETSTPTIFQDIDNAKLIKKALDCKIVLMGSHVSVFDREILEEHTEIDAVIRGEYEEAALDLCTLNWSEIEGITYRHENKILQNPKRKKYADINSLPFPAWDKFDLNFYDWALLPSPAMLMIATRGCPFKCSYCLWPEVMYGHIQRRRSPENIVEEMDYLVKHYGIKGIRFDDDTFALKPSYVAKICEAIIKKNLHTKISWSCFGHTSMVDKDLFQLMKKSGCVQIDFGVETGSSSVLQNIKKGTEIDNTIKAIQACRSLRIKTYATYMIGFPEETQEDIQKTIDLGLKLNTDFMQVSYVIPYPGTRLFDQCKAKGCLPYENDWKMYDATRPVIENKVSGEKLEKLYSKFWSRYYLRPKYVFYFIKKSLLSPKDFLKAIKGVSYIMKKVLAGWKFRGILEWKNR